MSSLPIKRSTISRISCGTMCDKPSAVFNTGHLYWLGYERDQGRFAAAQGREHRHSFGTRLFGSAKNWDWNLEAVFQIGHVGSQTISAWTVASDKGFTFTALPWSPRPGLKADIASGDKNPSDGRLTKLDKSGHWRMILSLF